MKGKKALVISKYGLDRKPFNTKYVSVTWKDCTLRAWLNKDFLNTAFDAEERKLVLTTKVDNSKRQHCFWNEDTYKNYAATKDRIFLLSYTEARTYFSTNQSRRCAPTDYAIKQGAYTNSGNKTSDGKAAGWWWLRSPGFSSYGASYVYPDGSFNCFDVSYAYAVIRPAFWLNLESEN